MCKEKAIGTNVNSGFQGWLRVPSTNLEYIEKQILSIYLQIL